MQTDGQFSINQTTGDSHVFRNSEHCRKYFRFAHLYTDNTFKSLNISKSDYTIVILPENDHQIDYINNQFTKENQSNLLQQLLKFESAPDLLKKLQQGWNWDGNLIDAPQWMLREWFSFYIDSNLKQSYNIHRYRNINADFTLSTSELFDKNSDVFQRAIKTIGYNVTENTETIEQRIVEFIKLQNFHNSQKRCVKWVTEVLNGQSDLPIPWQTLFDEAYVQFLLREHGVMVQCNGLNSFPKTTSDMIKYLYIQ